MDSVETTFSETLTKETTQFLENNPFESVVC